VDKMIVLHTSTYGRKLKAEQVKQAKQTQKKSKTMKTAARACTVDEQVRCARTLHVPRENHFECDLILCPRPKPHRIEMRWYKP